MEITRLVQRDPGPIPPVIRRFSDDIEEQGDGEASSEGLIVKVSRDHQDERRLECVRREWTLLLADADHVARMAVPDEEKHMLETSRRLAKAWEKFQRSLPTAQQGSPQDSPPSLSILFNSVRNAENTRRHKRNSDRLGKVKNSFARITQFGNDHSQLLQMIPSNDKYISLITGSLSAIVQASVNHEDLAEALTDSLDELCADVAHWKKQVLAHRQVPEMQRLIRELYVVLFEFLTDIFEAWSSSSLKRLAFSFNKNALEKLFRSKKTKIDRLTTELDRAARLDTDQKINQLSQNLDQAVTKADFENFLRQLGSDVQRFPQEKGSSTSDDTLRLTAAATPNESTSTGRDTDDATGEEASLTVQRTEYLAVIPGAFIHGQHEEIQRVLESVWHLQVDRLVITKLREWINGKADTQLWIQGPAHVPKPSQNTLTAVSLLGKAAEANMTTLCYFATLGASSSNFHPANGLRRMLQSLLVQVVMVLPENVSARGGISPTMLGSCFEDDAAVSSILDVHQELIEQIPKPVLCILDGLQILEDRSNRTHTKELAETFEQMCGEVSSESTDFKLCVTTDGYVDLISALVQKSTFDSIAYELESDNRQANDTGAMRYADVLEH